MNLFYKELLKFEKNELKNEEFHHCVDVLRHKTGDQINLTDGMGTFVHARITGIQKDSLFYDIIDEVPITAKPFYCHIAIGPTKQMERMEWFVEKACELGVDEITFIQTQNSERSKLRMDRLEKKTISALKQSKGAFKTRLNSLTLLKDFVEKCRTEKKLIATVNPQSRYLADEIKPNQHVSILIGPEGDFTPDEINKCTTAGFEPVSMGEKVLRTETAGIVASQFVNMVNRY